MVAVIAVEFGIGRLLNIGPFLLKAIIKWRKV